jgi:hypothetical protein
MLRQPKFKTRRQRDYEGRTRDIAKVTEHSKLAARRARLTAQPFRHDFPIFSMFLDNE